MDRLVGFYSGAHLSNTVQLHKACLVWLCRSLAVARLCKLAQNSRDSNDDAHIITTMSWFNKRKERNLIPPVEGDSNSTSTGSRSATTGGATSTDAVRDRYHRNNAVDIYSRGQGDLNSDRSELFSGYNPEKASNNRFAHEGPTLREPAPGEENEEDVEAIKQQTKFVKQESVNSTRNALRMAREAEETARGTINRLGSQSGSSRFSYYDSSISDLTVIFERREACEHRAPSRCGQRPLPTSGG